MNKIIPFTLTFVSFSIFADWQDTIDFVGDTFNVSVSKVNYLGDSNDEQLTYTLIGSHYLNDEWRIFGQVDSDKYLELGIGYSFTIADQIYNEVSTSIGGNDNDVMVYSGGLFSAIMWQDIVFYSNLSAQYVNRDNIIFDSLPESRFKWEYVRFDKTIGSYCDLTDWLSVSLSYTHKASHYQKLSGTFVNMPIKRYPDSDYEQYISPGFTFTAFGIKPSVSYNYYYEEKERSYIDFNLNFDF